MSVEAPAPTLGDILGAFLSAYDPEVEKRIEARAQLASAYELSRRLAPLLRVGEEDVFQALTYVPDNMLPLLKSPEGWAALSALVATDLGAGFVPVPVTIH